MNDELLYEVINGAAWLTINREAVRNSISPELVGLFNHHLDAAENAVEGITAFMEKWQPEFKGR